MALNSFNPIPVEKNNLRNVMTTFDDTVKVLSEGDNVLIFPERPRKVKRGDKMTVEHLTDSVGRLFTGFANIGRLYYETTGKCLRFYPIYASKRNHTFRIGQPVVFSPDNDPHDEKQRIADLLHDQDAGTGGVRRTLRRPKHPSGNTDRPHTGRHKGNDHEKESDSTGRPAAGGRHLVGTGPRPDRISRTARKRQRTHGDSHE